MKKKKLLWIFIGLVILVIGLVGLKSAGVIGKDEGLKVATEKVETRNITETVNASGKVYPEVEVKVSPDISGEIVELQVKEGDSVRKGQVLAKIYADIYSTQRNQAAAEVNRQQAMVDNSKAQLESLQSALDLAKSTYERQKKLLADKIISNAEFEQAENSFRTAQANYNAAVQNIRSGQAGIASSVASLERANKDLSRTAVLSPMSGTVSLLNVKAGERVVGNSMMAGTEMMRIADMGIFEVQVDVGENDIPKVKMYDSALVEIDAYNNRKFKGIVTQIASSNTTASAAAATSNDVTNYKVHIRLLRESYQDLFDPSRPRYFPFRPGMNASADIQTRTKANVLSANINAVSTREKGTDKIVGEDKDKDKPKDNSKEEEKTTATDLDEVVFVLQKDGTVKKIVVKTGIQDINNIEVTEGLKAGDEIIVAPYNVISKTLKDGMKVKVVAKDKLFEVKK
ncbi:efflux transporter periplasmic adaptor subunit [Niastella yeongjuensis]|uniref:Efflux transporter periplasmic adaptor subunit n=1 Tax=Niastella yeongjuensis TaxID=354355 RepID=A0A1V9EXP6_9BACT|nr:efflux RND transporter periplasmic adaptor subunit [Niastella yeongjuensis]OQP50897.1 efflux transporter periplasmic adaptor subunit [Niastella yeongjuensis]SEN12551.1 HlyD family secretion protein [Niastella yeongjuensis]